MKYIIISIMGLLISCSQPKTNKINTQTTKNNPAQKINQEGLEEAILGMGCFWCTEAVFEELRGVVSVESGYTGGKTENPTYDDISHKETGHAEVALIKFDPKVISFETLLDVFWTTHDPTTLNRQGNDVGTQYRSAIFYRNDQQKSIAELSKKEVAPTVWDNPIITEITPLSKFYSAEEYHQNFYIQNKSYGYCVAVINPKLDKLHKKFTHLLKGAEDKSSLETLTPGNFNSLSDFDKDILLNQGTERAFSGVLWDNKEKGTYLCKQCNQPLFKSDAKFESKTGWPSFDDEYKEGAIEEVRDGYRVEIVCSNCKGHLGHVFKGEGFTEKQTRHCVNSASLQFKKQ